MLPYFTNILSSNFITPVVWCSHAVSKKQANQRQRSKVLKVSSDRRLEWDLNPKLWHGTDRQGAVENLETLPAFLPPQWKIKAWNNLEIEVCWLYQNECLNETSVVLTSDVEINIPHGYVGWLDIWLDDWISTSWTPSQLPYIQGALNVVNGAFHFCTDYVSAPVQATPWLHRVWSGN